MATKYELSEEEKKKAKAYLEQISNQKKEEAQLPTASKSSSNTLPLYSKSNSISLPTAKLATKKESKNIKELNKGDGFKLTDGLYDDRTELQKAKDNVAGVIGNVAMGVESVVPNITKYLNSANKFATKKATSTIANMTLEKITGNKDIANRASGIIGDTVGEKIHNSFNPIAKTNQELNNKDMEEWRNNTIQYNIQRTNNPLSSKLAEMGPSLGNNLLPMAVAAAPVPGARLLSTAMFMTSAGGSYLDDAKQRGMTDDQAFGYATVMGGLEGGTESVISGDMVNKGIKLATGKELSSELLNSFGLNIAENFLQEAVMEPLSEVTATVTGGKESANWDNIWQRTLTAGIDGALSSVLLAGATIGVGSATNVVNRYNNGERVTQSEIKQALHDVQNSGKINVEEIIEGSIKALNQNNKSNLQQNITNNANNIQEQQTIPSEIKMPQNQNMEQLPVANEENRYNDLKELALGEINNSKISKEEKNLMIEALNSVNEISDNDIETIKQTIKNIEQSNSNELETKANYRYDENRRKKYMQYKNDNSSYDSTEVEQVLDMIPTNRNGRRTVKQWLTAADEIGKRIANLSNEEIERIAYKSWFDIQPSKSITQYDNVAKQQVGFQKFTSDEWINAINNAVNEERANNQEQENTNKLSVENKENRYNGITKNDNLITSAQKYNLNYKDISIESIQQVMDKAGIRSRFDVNEFTNENGKVDENIGARWSLQKEQDGTFTREIVFNPQASEKTVIQEMAIHELFHDVFAKNTTESNELYKNVRDYLEQDEEYKNQFNNLKEQYINKYGEIANIDNLITEEAISKTLQTKLGTQEEIDRLVNYKPTVARKIYDWVVDKLNKITGNKIEKLYWEDVRNKFERAYSQNGDYNSSEVKTKYHVSENLSNDLDNILSNIQERNPVRLRDYTPSTLVENGIKDLPMYENPSHIRKNILTEAEAMKLGLAINPRDNYHGLGKDIYIKAIDSLDNPRVIFKNKNNSQDYLILTVVKDMQNRNIVVPIEIETNTTVNNVKIDTNRVKSVYGFEEKNNIDLNDYIKYNLKNNNFEKIYEQKKDQGTGFSTAARSSINSISSSTEEVNTTNKYSIQESENNTELSEEAKKQLHRYVGLDNETLNKKISDAIENKQNMYEEAERIRKEYKEFQNTEEFKSALEEFAHSDNISQQIEDIMNKAQKYADKIRYYDNAYKEYQAQYEAINSILMENEKNTRSVRDIVKEAEKHFGVTNDFKETAYIDINGKQIDFSGKHEGGPSGERTLDHRQINEIDTDMNTFIDMGNIRILPEGGGINLKIEPNSKQYSKLREYIDSVNGEIYIDIDKANNTYDSAEYKAGTSSSKIISDLQYYFRNGKFPAKSSLADFRYSIEKKNFDQYIEDRIGKEGTRTSLKELQLPTAKNNKLETGEYTRQQKDKILNPSEISNLSREDANTTPKLNSKKYERGNKQSNFLSNIVVDSQFLNEDLRKVMSQDENIRYYKGITNEETLEKAYNSLKDGGEKETLNWFSKNDKNTSAEDVAKGWILLKQYQDSGDYQGAVEVAKKMRQMGTSAGQAVQAYNILSRLTPEGMFYYAQSELDEVYNKMVEGKSKQWIEANQDKFNLTQDETQIILDTMKEVSELEDGREKNVKLAQIQKLISDKIPATTGQSVKAWMRISMLFNPKTQVRNVMGNAVVIPVNATSDVFAGALDKLISKKTGIRTTGITKEGIKGYAKGFGKGVFESYDDFRKGINTRNVEGNRFEIGEGKSFKDEGIGKALNRVDNILSFALDVGDRGFYEATFTNSINNQMILNNTTKVTQDMIDIATNEALQRTWQDSNNYTQAVLSIRNILNKANVKGYGLGDVLIPFAKTPANLTKAIVDYSPVGLTKTLALDAKKFTNSLQNGQYSAQLQHNFVQNIGKGLAGTLLYVLAYGLAKAGIATGESDDDKDVKNFMKNSLGISSYSIKIGDKSFTYDWAQPVATPLAIMTNYVKYSKDNPDANAITKAIKAATIGSEQLLQQSFLQSLNTVLNGKGETLENLSQAVLELPARAIPTFSKQIADMVDGTQRTAFEYDKPLESAINSVKAKIPGLSQTLPSSVDTLGNEIKKYGGNNDLWNVMLNPANTNKGKLSKSGEEIYNVYMQTGDTTIFPRTAPYYINSKGEKITMTSAQRNKFQTISGKYVEESLNSLLTNKNYKKLSNDEKASVINEIVSDAYSKAKYDVLGLDSTEYSKKRETLKDVRTETYYSYKINTTGLKKDADKMQVLVNSNYSNKEKIALYENYIKSSEDKKYDIIKTTFTENGLNIDKYLQYKLAESDGKFKANKKDNGTVDGKSISGSAKEKRFNYIENIKGASYSQKVILFALEHKPSRQSDKNIVINYVKNNTKSNKDALEFLKNFAGVTIYKDGTFDY